MELVVSKNIFDGIEICLILWNKSVALLVDETDFYLTSMGLQQDQFVVAPFEFYGTFNLENPPTLQRKY